MVVSIKMNKKEVELAEAFAKSNGLSLNEMIKTILFEKINEEYDEILAAEALEEYKKNPKTYSIKEMKEELGF